GAGGGGPARIGGRAGSHEMAFSTRNAAPWTGAASLQLCSSKTLAPPITTALGPCGAEGDTFGRSLAMARTSGPGTSLGEDGGPSSGHVSAPTTLASPNALLLV